MREHLVKAFLYGTAYLPLPVLHVVGSVVGWLMFYLPNATKKVTAENISACLPELSAKEKNSLVRRNLVEISKVFTESGFIWLRPSAEVLGTIREVHGAEAVRAALAKGCGVIMASPHLGCWEMAGLFCTTLGPITSLYREPKLAALGSLVRRSRERSGAKLVPADRSGVRALLAALHRNELVGILPDQDPGRDNGVFGSFFGKRANTMNLLARLAQKTNAPWFLIYAERLPRGQGFRIVCRPGDEQVHSDDPTVAVTAMNATVERAVRAIPGQYLWSYKRFKRPPP